MRGSPPRSRRSSATRRHARRRSKAEAYADPAALRADLATLARALREQGGSVLNSGGALGRLVRAVDTFGFHLAALDLRQNADVHERVVAELLAVAGVEVDYLALDEAARVETLRRELAHARPLSSAWNDYSDETRSELAILHAAAEAHALYGPACIGIYNISKAESVSDMLEVHTLLKEVGLYRPARRHRTPPSWRSRCSRRSATSRTRRR